MRNRLIVIAALMASASCSDKGDSAGFEIKREVKRDTKKSTGSPGPEVGTLADAMPSLTINGASGAVAESIKRRLDSSYSKKGAVTIDVQGLPDRPPKSGKVDAKLLVKALFAHPPKLTKLEGTLDVTLTYTNATLAQLGDDLGGAVVSWLDGEELPTDLGVPTGSAAKVTRIAAGAMTICTLHEDKSVRCWSRDRPEVMPIPKAAGSIAISSASNFGVCGVREDGKAWCLDAWSSKLALEVREVCGISGAVDVSVGQSTACALLADGHVRCWPRDEQAYAPCDDAASAVAIARLADAVSLETGPFTSCAIRKDGSVACWENCGKDCKSRTAGGIDPQAPPEAAAVKGLANAKQLVYPFQPCAWIGDDRVVCAATKDLKASDTKLPEPIKQLARSRAGVCALSTKGNVFCTNNGKEATKLEGVSDLVAIGGGLAGMCGVTSENEIVCWGGMSGDEPPTKVPLTY